MNSTVTARGSGHDAACVDRAAHLAERAADWAALDLSLAILWFTPAGRILRASDHFLRMFHYSAEALAERPISILRAEIDPAQADGGHVWATLRRGEPHTAQYRCRRGDGSPIWVRATCAPVIDADGEAFKILAIVSDITAEKLRAADDQGQIAAIHKSHGVIAFAMDGTILDANALFLDAMGYKLHEIEGRHHRMFVEPAHAHGADYANFWNDLSKGRHRTAEFRRLGKDGREVWLQASYNPIFDLDGNPYKVVKYATVVTQEKLRQADHHGQIAAIRKAQCVIAFDMDGTIIEANENFLAAMGYRLAEIEGRHHRIFVEPDFAETADYAEFWSTLRAGQFHSAMYKRLGKDGRTVWIQASYNPIFDLSGRPFKVIKFASDVTRDVALAEALKHAKRQAQHDAGTALPNRVRLAGFMSSALSEPGARLAVFYLDLDRFKPVNDTYGHHVGDKVLSEIADRLRRIAAQEQIVARVGGDEFVLAAPNLPADAIETLCRDLIAAVTQPIRHEEHELTIGLSIGVAISPGDGTTPEDLLRCADAALYRSKRQGRGGYSFFNAAKTDRPDGDRHGARDLRRGLAAGEFFLEYQPRFDVRTRAVRSVEAQVRWGHPERGRLEPEAFMPLAQTCGMMVPLGAFVLRMACRAARDWPDIGVSVHVSPAQFRDARLIETVAAVLEESDLAPEKLAIAVTESVLLEDSERAHAVLDALKGFGVTLAVDDFGTGHCALDSLRAFPFDIVTLDRTFVADMERRDGGRAIVRSILGLAKAFELSVTAKGVETAGQLLLLTLDECAEVQGSFLAHPMAGAALSDFLSRDGRMFCATA